MTYHESTIPGPAGLADGCEILTIVSPRFRTFLLVLYAHDMFTNFVLMCLSLGTPMSGIEESCTPFLWTCFGHEDSEERLKVQCDGPVPRKMPSPRLVKVLSCSEEVW